MIKLIAVIIAAAGIASFCFGVANYANKMCDQPSGYPSDAIAGNPDWDIEYKADYCAAVATEAIEICGFGVALAMLGIAIHIWNKRRPT